MKYLACSFALVVASVASAQWFEVGYTYSESLITKTRPTNTENTTSQNQVMSFTTSCPFKKDISGDFEDDGFWGFYAPWRAKLDPITHFEATYQAEGSATVAANCKLVVNFPFVKSEGFNDYFDEFFVIYTSRTRFWEEWDQYITVSSVPN
jgi:hypothetical protein